MFLVILHGKQQMLPKWQHFGFFLNQTMLSCRWLKKIGWAKLKVGSLAQCNFFQFIFFNSREAQGLCSW